MLTWFSASRRRVKLTAIPSLRSSSAKKTAAAARFDTDLDAEDLQDLVCEYKAEIKKTLGKEFPEDPMEQLWGAIGAVFGSWNNDRAIAYRELYQIPHNWGTAVNVQAMVFGNLGDDCATGVAFTRDPATAKSASMASFWSMPKARMSSRAFARPNRLQNSARCCLRRQRAAGAFASSSKSIIEKCRTSSLPLKRASSGCCKRAPASAPDLLPYVLPSIWSKNGSSAKKKLCCALSRISSINCYDRFSIRKARNSTKTSVCLGKGLPAGPGAATGRVVFHAEDAVEWKKRGERVVLCRIETSPDDIRGMDAAQGILTARGGMTSHAALVARQMGKVCVAGCEALHVDYAARTLRVDQTELKEGDWISIDGSTGEVFQGEIQTLPSEVFQVLLTRSLDPKESRIYRQFAKLMKWADEVRTLGVRTNADQPDQAAIAKAFGSEGIGLCRTEHMFFQGERIQAVREMILADDEAGRRRALAKLLPMQKEDFKGILEIMGTLPVTIRTLDPPLA